MTHQKPGHTDSGGDLAPSLGGGGTFFRGPRFLNDVFSGKISIFTAKISDDLFLVIDHVFLIFRIHYFTKEFLDNTSFLLYSYFRVHPTTLFQKILGGRMHGPSPSSNFGGTVTPRSPPLHTEFNI